MSSILDSFGLALLEAGRYEEAIAEMRDFRQRAGRIVPLAAEDLGRTYARAYQPAPFKGVEYIRIGSFKKKLKDPAKKERELWCKGPTRSAMIGSDRFFGKHMY